MCGSESRWLIHPTKQPKKGTNQVVPPAAPEVFEARPAGAPLTRPGPPRPGRGPPRPALASPTARAPGQRAPPYSTLRATASVFDFASRLSSDFVQQC